MHLAMNFATAVIVRALAVVFVLAIGAFLQDILAGDLGDLLARAAFWLAILLALIWGLADGRASRDIIPPLLLWLVVAVLVLVAGGILLNLVASRGSEEASSWLAAGWQPFLIALLPGAAGAGLGWAARDHLPERFRPVEYVD